MIQTFKLKNGEISIDSDRLLISDDFKKQKRNKLLSSGLWIFYGIISVLRFLKTGDQFLLWTGLIIGIGHIVVFTLTLIKTDKKELLFSEIKSIKEKKIFNSRYIDIRLKNNKVRQLIPQDNFKDILELLKRV
ncbi:MAG: hypothetical protein RBS07_18660 [Lentimicrobium sp.]|jgi:hypothetical protein|nr:hypothetical protein [Lentimicrobium sp.]